MATATSLIRVEKPHSLSYQLSTRPRPPSTIWVCGRATVDDAAMWLKSMETSGSLVTARMPLSGALPAASSMAALISSAVTFLPGTNFRSTTETFAVGRGRDDHPLGAGLQVGGRLVPRGEEAGALQGNVDAQGLVGQLGGVADGGDLDRPQAHVDRVAVDVDEAGEAAVDAVVAQEVGVGLDGAQVVDRHHLDVAAGVLDDRAQHQPADAAETVDGDANGHAGPP